MTLRSRPVLDRKHRPRWQDELRTQQLIVIGFAMAISLAVGIFGAASWNGYWDAHLRPAASVAGTTYDRADLEERERILVAEASATIVELQAQLGGPRDQFIEQQIQTISGQLADTATNAAESLVDGAVLTSRADDFSVSITDDALDTALAERFTLEALVRAQLILVNALPADAEPDAEPTEAQLETARQAAQTAVDRIEGGEEFATVAAEASDDFTASSGGVIGWFGAGDPAYGQYFAAVDDAAVGEVIGPFEADGGLAVVEVLDRREATTDSPLRQILSAQGVDEATYRRFVGNDVMLEAYRTHFADEVVVSPAVQRRVAQIFIAAASGTVVFQERARHVLISPLPEDAAEGTEPTDEQIAAALEEAEEVRVQLSADDADWFAIAEASSDDPQSGVQGGDLGWYDPAAPGFVAEFVEALGSLDVGDLSEPVRTEFGYHLIQKTDQRESPQAQAAGLVEELRADPDSFAEVATRASEEYETAREGGELGWVAPYQLDPALEAAVFGLEEVGDISEPIDDGSTGITIYQLLETDDEQEIPDERLEQIRANGFDRWLEQEVRAPVPTWVDPQFATTAA